MIHLDGAELRNDWKADADVVIVGSGPGGAAAARVLARAGAKVVVLEEGPWLRPEEAPRDGFESMATHYRDLGAQIAQGRAPLPLVQGRALGGTSVVNGAISWRLPEDVHAGWVAADPALGEALPWSALDAVAAEVEADLGIAPTDPSVAGAKNRLLGEAAEKLGLAHRPIARNVRGCQGLGRCLQGCPIGAKQSMDRTYLPDAAEAGARLVPGVRVERLSLERGRAVGVVGRAHGGGRVEVRAGRVIVAASAIGTPVLLRRSGLRHGPVGDRLQCHPGVSVAGRFHDPVVAWRGATQGHEVTGLRSEGIKIEALGFDLGLLAARLEGLGRRWSRDVADLAHWADWGAAIRTGGEGWVRHGWRRPRLGFRYADGDGARVRRAVIALGELFFAAGADRVSLGVLGVADPRDAAELRTLALPEDPRAYAMVATHLFGTCRLGSDPRTSVVRPDLRHHATDGLYVTDASVFPSNTGVNPQTTILCIATHAMRTLAATG